ncbi:MAG: nicotinate (nicotinamide) nucleotide adenylyltransferase [Phycisphaerales bacterium]|nr:MAG: nicotinate (nicotinamide) nucleotide adenylyltransferase [Phycisphaerales bacterium]
MSERPRRILLFGGTFDPPHLAHTRLPPIVADQLGCFRILYIPATISPHKLEEPPTEVQHRLAMLTLALSDVPEAEICTLELDRPGPSFTCDTLEALRREHGSGVTFRLLIGTDQALAFHEWENWPRVLELAVPAVMVRPPLDKAAFSWQLRQAYDAEEAERWLSWSVRVPAMEISSSEVRRRLLAGEDTAGLLDPTVAQYIAAHKLYTAVKQA